MRAQLEKSAFGFDGLRKYGEEITFLRVITTLGET